MLPSITRVDRWLATHRPDYYAQLQPGVDDAALDAFESQFSLRLPAAFGELYRWKNGQRPDCNDSLQGNRMIVPLEVVSDSKAEFDSMIGYDFEDPRYWRRGWVPFLHNGGGSYLCLDLAAEDGGSPGQLIGFWKADADRPVELLVRGVPITRYCDEHRLTPRDRLGLFVQVCSAVQHAHQKGVIHRDLKPSNVLVAQYDGRPVPKVIDFGIAKATVGQQQLADGTMFTGFGAVVGTPEYMSPEQAELNQLDVDTRTDVYSLGVLLYELLTGSTPLDRGRFNEAALLEVLRVVREEDPPRPSTRLSTTDALPSIAASRGVEPKKLSGLVRGELDWIAMKALEKDRARRYETANGLARDVERYLSDEPVQACPPSAAYRLRTELPAARGGGC